MKIKRLIIPSLLIFLLEGCFTHRQAYYFSPFNGNHSTYNPIPLISDSMSSASYAGQSITTGSANYRSHDKLTSFKTRLHRSHSGTKFQFYYGADMTLGYYDVKPYDTFSSRFIVDFLNAETINRNAGKKFFGGFGLSGGLDYVLSLGNRTEWRVMGIESSYNNEFGEYLTFRRLLPDSAVTAIVRSKLYGTLGLSTEIVARIGMGNGGVKLGYGWILGNAYNHIYDPWPNDPRIKFRYFFMVFQYTLRRWSWFTDFNFGTRTTQVQFGTSFRISKTTLFR
jgi:hypothetical protein